MTSHSRKNVVVTGMGVIAPNGTGLDAFWESIHDGRSAADRIPGPEAADMDCRISCRVREFEPLQFFDPKQARRMNRSSQLGVAAAQMAIDDSGLALSSIKPHRVGIYEGTALSGVEWLLLQHIIYLEKGLARVNPFTIHAAFVGSASGDIAMRFNLKGPSLTVCTSCASGADAIGLAVRTIQNGEADVMIAGGNEAPLYNPILAFFTRMGVTSRLNEDPGGACRPFNTDRDGIVMGEGAAYVVLESEDGAVARGARIRGVVSGYGRSCDAHHVTQPHPEGEGAKEAMRRALEDSGLPARRIDYINAHGTGTPLNDVVEAKAIREIFGAWGEQVPISSTKPVTGHLMGAAGAVEAVVTLLAMEHQTAPPHINLDRPDKRCLLNLVQPPARSVAIKAALSNSFGFGGKNTCLIFTRQALDPS